MINNVPPVIGRGTTVLSIAAPKFGVIAGSGGVEESLDPGPASAEVFSLAPSSAAFAHADEVSASPSMSPGASAKLEANELLRGGELCASLKGLPFLDAPHPRLPPT